MSKRKSIQELVNIANSVKYEYPVIVKGERPTRDDIPDYSLDDCERIVNIIKERCDGQTLDLEMAYDLWYIHSRNSFLSSWSCMDGVSDDVIFNNLMSLMEKIEYQ